MKKLKPMSIDRQWQDWLNSHITTMRADNNCLYIFKDIDVRLCPKNGSQTLKFMLYTSDRIGRVIPDNPKYRMSALMFPDYNLEYYEGWDPKVRSRFRFPILRTLSISKHADYMDFPFRPNTIRLAVKRDPVERFVSIFKYLSVVPADNHGDHKNLFKSIRLYDEPTFYDEMTVDEVLTGLEEKTIHNLHWGKQSYYMGNSSKYDKVFYLKDMRSMLEFIMDHNQDPRIQQIMYKRIVNLHTNKSENNAKENSKQLRNVELTDSQIKRVKKIYEEDYDNGWY